MTTNKRINYYIRPLIVLSFVFSTSLVFAQKKLTAEQVVESFQKKMLDHPKQLQPDSQAVGQNSEQLPMLSSYDSIKFFKELNTYDFNAYHFKRSLTWQYYSGIVIFFMVIIIVGLGLLLSYKQFQLTEMQIKNNLTKTKEESTTVELNNATIEVSQTGLKINTAVIGLAILLLSLVFFFLYLKYVYVIEIIG
jgi:hypothetical protein